MNIGDYARTKTGIHKIFRINENATSWKYHCDKKPTGEWDSSYEYIKIRAEDIIKSSPNIIDLIEVGDYVNGMKITNIWKNDETKDIEIEFNEKESYLYVKNWNYESRIEKFKIKSIITKEQIEQMEYKL